MSEPAADDQFEKVLADERALIEGSRRARGRTSDNESSDLAGLSLSSGGIRSATFAIGVLQGLADAGLLPFIDYLSCVGGGAYTGGWLAATLDHHNLQETIQLLKSDPQALPRFPKLAWHSTHRTAVRWAVVAIFGILCLLFGIGITISQESKAMGAMAGILFIAFFYLVWEFSLFKSEPREIALGYLGGDTPLKMLGRIGPYPLLNAANQNRQPHLLSPLRTGAAGKYQPTGELWLSHALVASGSLVGTEVSGYFAPIERFAARIASLPVAVLPGTAFDKLGVYELVRRRCRLIIACDATADPGITFQALADVIRKCRVDFGVYIEISLKSVTTTEHHAQTHYEIGSITYPDGTTGTLLLLRPVLTGDESTDVGQYASIHPNFPAMDVRPGHFDDAEYESYRLLGQHTIDSLAGAVKDSAEWPSMSLDALVGSIRAALGGPQSNPPSSPDEPMPSSGRDPVPQDLIEAVASGECVLCAGAGLAAQSGLPTSRTLVTGLLKLATETSLVTESAAKELSSAIAAGNYEEAGDELSHLVPQEQLTTYLQRSQPASSAPSRAHQLLAQMPFLGAINTNRDDLLAAAFGVDVLFPTDTAKLLSALQTSSRFAVNAAGSVSRPTSIVLNPRSFQQQFSQYPEFKQFLGTLFLQNHSFLVGFNLDGLRTFLDALSLSGRPSRQQFALIAREGPPDPLKVRYLDRTYNLRLIEYHPGFNYEGFTHFLEDLQRAVQPKARRIRPAAGNVTLKSISLENIGPFESISLDFTSGWNLLLGDNGKGKTVILRAIAAGLCGEAVDPVLLARLLRAGSDRGVIRLQLDTREHVTELTRTRDGKVQVKSASLSPIVSDRWLAIAFPALRSIPWENPAGPDSTGAKDPNSDDLVPLLRGSADSRVANLKQWLVNLDYTSRWSVIEEFFAALQKLTPGVRIDRPEIVKETMEIRIITDSGVVPLSAVSQGTGSVMCWIGTLLQRINETGVSPDARPLVLIDEVDAHMHPKWQQLFAQAFCDRFPRVQVIATTHSPLMVGSLKKEDIWLVHRVPLKSEIYGVARFASRPEGGTEVVVSGPEPDEDANPPQTRQERRYRIPEGAKLRIRDGDIVEAGEALTEDEVKIGAEHLDIPPEGWRVDQILMLPYFGLTSTRDSKTAELIQTYTKLASSPNPDEKKLGEVAAQLQVRAPAPHETEAARQAFDLIREFARERLQKLPQDQREKVLAEAQVQLTESITGSKRPI
ncbi:MAG TPA: AAA family ATPase [Bryobacteraceae bacterium]|jgi:hypothetical protein